jgi:flagellar secretion chaperone FliS
MVIPTDEYLETKVTTATPHQLHLMVIDGAIRYALAAEVALTRRKLDEANAALARARQFVGEMLAGLDATQLPEVVDNLKALFLFIHRNLVRAGLQHDPRLVTDSITILRLHRETWLALAERLKQDSAVEAPARSAGRFSWAS